MLFPRPASASGRLSFVAAGPAFAPPACRLARTRERGLDKTRSTGYHYAARRIHAAAERAIQRPVQPYPATAIDAPEGDKGVSI